MQSRLNRGMRTLVAWAAVTGLVVLGGCAGPMPADNTAPPALAATPGSPVLPAATAAASTPSPTRVPSVDNTPAPEPSSSTPSASVEPATPAASAEPPTGQGQSITLDNNGQTITMHPGERLVLQLGVDLVWTATSSDPAVISRVVNILTVRGSQGVYEAHAAGKATLAAIGDAACRQTTPPCMVPSRLFQIQVIVQ